jgi:hypothetical protein
VQQLSACDTDRFAAPRTIDNNRLTNMVVLLADVERNWKRHSQARAHHSSQLQKRILGGISGTSSERGRVAAAVRNGSCTAKAIGTEAGRTATSALILRSAIGGRSAAHQQPNDRAEGEQFRQCGQHASTQMLAAWAGLVRQQLGTGGKAPVRH